jgi:methyl-accepting chemotaxis protein
MQGIRSQGKAVERGALPSIAMADAIAIDLVKMRGETSHLIANADDPSAVTTSKINVEQLKNEVEKGFSDYIARVTDSAERDSITATPPVNPRPLHDGSAVCVVGQVSPLRAALQLI